MDKRICSKCKKEYQATSGFFHKGKHCKNGLRPVCKECVNTSATIARDDPNKKAIAKERARLYNLANKEVLSLRRKERYQLNKERIKEIQKENNKKPRSKMLKALNNFKRNFNLSSDDVQDLMNKQLGCCDICKESLVFPDATKRYYVDHDHETGKVRSLLCHYCNSMLGFSRDSIKNLELGAIYLKKF